MSTVDVARALYQFWNGFNIPAYPENSVPDDATLPYITYDMRAPNWSGMSLYNARVWYRDTSFNTILAKVSEISDEIGEGKRIAVLGGSIFLFKEDLFFQMMPSEDDAVKMAYLSMVIHVIA